MTDYKLEDVSLFENFSQDSLAKLKQLFSTQKSSRGEVLLEAGKVVPGLYVLTSGEVLVEIDDRILARIKKGGVVGEMSFLGKEEDASATIRVESDAVEYFFCPRESFLAEINSNDKFSRDFFRGVSILMSVRLRNTNAKINTELKSGFSKIADLIHELDENSKIDQTRESLDKTGSHIVAKLRETIPQIEELESHHPEEYDEFEKVLNNLKEIMVEDAQSFDRICQKIDQLRQYFDNLKTIIKGAGVFGIKGDKKLFTDEEVEQSTIEFL